MRSSEGPSRFDTARETIVSLRIPRWFASLGLGAWLLLGIVGVITVALIVFALVSDILIPLLMAAVLAAIVVPVVDRLETWHVPRWLGASLALLLGIVIVAGVLTLAVRGVAAHSEEIAAEASAAFDRVRASMADLGIERPQVEELIGTAVDVLLGGVVGRAVNSIAALLIGLVVSVFLLLFLLKDWATVTAWTAGHIGLPRPIGERVLQDAIRAFRAYALGLTIVGLANAATVAIGLVLIGVPLVPTIAALTFVTSYVPYFGAFVAGAFTVVIALGSGGITDALLALAVVLLANNTLQNILEPIAFGRPLRLHPLVVLVVTSAGTLLFGIVGAVLAAPVTSVAVSIEHELAEAGIFNDSSGLPAE